jgi:hypothetical protein
MSGLGEKYSLKSIKGAHIEAAPLVAAEQCCLREMLPDDAEVLQVYGVSQEMTHSKKKQILTLIVKITEASCVITKFPHPENDDTGSIGRLIRNCEAK